MVKHHIKKRRRKSRKKIMKRKRRRKRKTKKRSKKRHQRGGVSMSAIARDLNKAMSLAQKLFKNASG